MADCLFAFAAQSGLPLSNTLRLIEHVSKIKQNDSGPQGDLEDVHLTLTMALLYAVSASVINKVCLVRFFYWIEVEWRFKDSADILWQFRVFY